VGRVKSWEKQAIQHQPLQMEEARKEFAEALQTYRELAQKNPETYRPYVATTLNNLGNH
jgi:hypothetical protein